MNEKIFIPISACNEKDLTQTVISAINNATYPDRLYFGIFEQSSKNEYADFSSIKQEIIHIKAKVEGPIGVGLPRLNASLLTEKNKDFLLQIDAHMIFEKNWDVDLIKYYSLISQKYNNIIISTYVPWWYEDESKQIKLSADENYVIDINNFLGIENVNTCKLVFDNYEKNLYRGYPNFTGADVSWNKDKQYEEHFGISGHFMFTDFNFTEKISHDPFIPWGGDEPVVALRAWTRGYKIFTVPKPIVWHKNKWGPSNNGINTISLDKDDWRIHTNWSNKKLFDLNGKNIHYGNKRMKDIFLGDYVGFWGAPNKELLKEYERVTEKSFEEYYILLKEKLIESKNFETLRLMYE